MPSTGYRGCGGGDKYARKHNAWVDFTVLPASVSQTFADLPRTGSVPAGARSSASGRGISSVRRRPPGTVAFPASGVCASRHAEGGEEVFVELDPDDVQRVAVRAVDPDALSRLHFG